MKANSPKLVPMKVSYDEWAKAFNEASGKTDDPGWKSVDELSRAMNLMPRDVRAMIKKFMAEGKIDVVRVKRPAIDGSMRYVPVYSMKEKA